MSRLDELFAPPQNLLFEGNFQQARRSAVVENKWLLVNIQCRTEFSSHQLNRDTWANQTVQEIIRCFFLFFQQDQESDEGRKYCGFYLPTKFPTTAIIDPQTGECLAAYHGFISSELFIERVFEFLEKYNSDLDRREQIMNFLGLCNKDTEYKEEDHQEKKLFCEVCLKHIKTSNIFLHEAHCRRQYQKFITKCTEKVSRSPERVCVLLTPNPLEKDDFKTMSAGRSSQHFMYSNGSGNGDGNKKALPELAEELLATILEFLDPLSILTCGLSCMSLHRLSHDGYLWAVKLVERYIGRWVPKCCDVASQHKHRFGCVSEVKIDKNIETEVMKISYLQGHDDYLSCMDYLRIEGDSEILVTGSADHSAILWNLRTGKPHKRFRGHTSYLNAVCADKYKLVSVGEDCRMCLWSLHASPSSDVTNPIWWCYGHTKPILCCGMDLYNVNSGRDHKCVTGSWNYVKLWDLERQVIVKDVSPHRGATFGVQMYGSLVMTCSGDRTLSLWDTRTHLSGLQLKQHRDSVYCLKWDGGNTAVSGSYDKTVRVWDLRNLQAIKVLRHHQKAVESISCSALKMVSGSRDGSVCVYDTKTWELLSSIPVIGGGGLDESKMTSVSVSGVAMNDDHEMFLGTERGGLVIKYNFTDV